MTAEGFKKWMTEYIKSETFSKDVVMKKLNSVRYEDKHYPYVLTGNSVHTAVKFFDNPTATYNTSIKYNTI